MIGLVTSTPALGLDADLPLLLDELPDASPVVWDDPSVDWAAFDAVVVRSAWDYPDRRDEFVAWAHRVAAVTRLWNPAPLIEWNTDKRYLADLGARGVPVVATELVEPGGSLERVRALAARSHDLVVKPSVGAGSNLVARFVGDVDGTMRHIESLHAAGRAAMVQPYLAAIDTEGETGLVFVDGEYSHAFRKGPILVAEIEWEGGLYAKEEISSRTPTGDQLVVAQRAVDAVGPTAYARVDLVPGADGPELLELELVEPSLFLHLDPAAPARAAAAFERRAR